MASISYPFSTSIFGYLLGHHFSFFWRLWAAPGLSKVAVLKSSGGLLRFFIENGPKMVAKTSVRTNPAEAFWRPRAFSKRSKNVSATQARFFVDFGPPFGDIFKNLAYFLNLFRRHHRQFLQFLGLKMFGFHRRLPKGVGGRPATTIRRHRPVSWRDQTG